MDRNKLDLEGILILTNNSINMKSLVLLIWDLRSKKSILEPESFSALQRSNEPHLIFFRV